VLKSQTHDHISREAVIERVREKSLRAKHLNLISDTFSNRGCGGIAKHTSTSTAQLLLNVSEKTKRLTREESQPDLGHVH